MQVKELPVQFQAALPILETIQAAGFEAYFVGGSVRDTLLGLPIHDVDIASSAYPQEIKALFQKTVDTGIEHGTVMVLDHGQGYEITTFRTESTYQDFRRPDKVEFVRSLEEDLKRRDLTINALAMDAQGQIVDLFHGLEDLDAQVIRAVGDASERFHEDALRMMRAVRFASQLDFSLEAETAQAIAVNAPLLEKIAVERIHVEWIKLMLGKNPARGLASLVATKLYQFCPSFAKQAPVFDRLTRLELQLDDEAQVWTLLAYLMDLDVKQTNMLLRQWKSSKDLMGQVVTALTALRAITQNSVDQFVLYATGPKGLATASQVAVQLGFKIDLKQLQASYAALPIKSKKDLAVDGGILIKEAGIKPGPGLGKILAFLEKEVLLGRLLNEKTTLLAALATK